MQHLADLITSVSAMVPMAQEFYLFCFFCMGFVLFRTEAVANMFRRAKKTKQTKVMESAAGEVHSIYTLDRLREDFSKRRYEQVLEGWSHLEMYTVEALCLVVNALQALGRPDDVGLFVAKAAANFPQLRPGLHEVVSAVASPRCEVRRQHVSLALRDLYENARDLLDVSAVKELLLSLARVNDEQRVAGLLGALAAQKAPASPELLGKVVNCFLACKNLDASLGYLQQVLATPSAVEESPAELIIAVVRVSVEAFLSDDSSTDCARPQAWDALDGLEGAEMPDEAAVLFLEWSARQTPVDVAMATRVELMLRKNTSSARSLPLGAYDALVRVHASSAGIQSKAIAYFDELAQVSSKGLNKSNCLPSEGSLVGMISSCVEARNCGLAEHILGWARAKGRCSLPVFSATLKVLAASKQSEKICAIYEEACSEGLVLDDAAYGQLINFAVQAGRVELARTLFKRAKNPDAQNYMSLMRACGAEGKVDQALEMLRELQQCGEVDTMTYNCALDVCVSCGNADAADKVLKEMEAAGRVDVVSYNIMLKQCVSDGANLKSPETVLEDMRKRGLKPNTATYNSLLGGALAAGNFERAWRTIDRMESSGGVDAYTVSILFKGYKRERRGMDAEAVHKALGLIEKHKVKVDEVLVNVALEACVALRDMHQVKVALEIFKRSGWAVPKQCAMHTYGVLIKAHGQSQNLEEAWRLWNLVTVEKAMEASEQLYGQMLDALVTNGCLDDALALFEDMKSTHRDTLDSQGFAVAYAMIIRGFSQRRECAKALRCYEEMKQNGTKVSLVVLNTLIDACSRVGDMEAAGRVFDEMVDLQCEPDVITYTTLIKGYCVCGNLDYSLQLFASMRKKGIRPDAIVFNSILDGCAKKQMTSLCEQVIRDMEEADVKPSNHSASILIKLYGRTKNLEAAFQVVNVMPAKYGFRANNAVYTCLMSACIANGKLDQAMALRLRMSQERINPDEKMYSTLLRGTLRASSVEQCIRVIADALEQRNSRMMLDEELVWSVLLLIRRRNLWEAHGRELVERLKSAGVAVRCTVEGPQASTPSWNPSSPQQRGERAPPHSPQQRGERPMRPPQQRGGRSDTRAKPGVVSAQR